MEKKTRFCSYIEGISMRMKQISVGDMLFTLEGKYIRVHPKENTKDKKVITIDEAIKAWETKKYTIEKETLRLILSTFLIRKDVENRVKHDIEPYIQIDDPADVTAYVKWPI